MIKHNKKGFTLIELLVVVLIIGILAAMAMPSYFKAVERSRAAEADTLIGTVVNAQQRYKMKTGKFTENWRALDVAPANAVEGDIYCTKGGEKKGEGDAATYSCGDQNGFEIKLVGTDAGNPNTSGVIAKRVGTGQYTYTIEKKYDSTNPAICNPGTTGADGEVSKDNQEFCMDYHSVDTAASLPKVDTPTKKSNP